MAKNKEIKEAVDKCKYLTGDDSIKRLATVQLLKKLDYNSAIEHAHNDGTKEGIEEGTKKGMEEEKINIAKKMKEINISINEISKVTGLSIDEINKI
ncbi:MAG: hypothetical protein RR136_01080 [Clostridia bacterium]